MRFSVLIGGLLLAVFAGAAEARPLVAVIDSGVARTAELDPVLVAEYDMASLDPRAAFQPRYDHGTMVATILNREARGAVDIVSFRIDDPAGCPRGATPPCQPSAAPIAGAIRKAASLGVDAINISLAMADYPAIVDAVHDATARGITVVMAAGNDGLDHPGNLAMARAGFPRAVLVGAVDADGKPWSGTNRPDEGENWDYRYVWRRGVDVPATSASGLRVIGTGTSFAAPIETAHRMLAEEAAARAQGAGLATASR